jgi:hypothetical protein
MGFLRIIGIAVIGAIILTNAGGGDVATVGAGFGQVLKAIGQFAGGLMDGYAGSNPPPPSTEGVINV